MTNIRSDQLFTTVAFHFPEGKRVNTQLVYQESSLSHTLKCALLSSFFFHTHSDIGDVRVLFVLPDLSVLLSLILYDIWPLATVSSLQVKELAQLVDR